MLLRLVILKDHIALRIFDRIHAKTVVHLDWLCARFQAGTENAHFQEKRADATRGEDGPVP